MEYKSVSLFRGTTGLNNNIAPSQIEKREDGKAAITECLNVYVEDSGRLVRCPGISQVYSGSCHSLFHGNGYCLFVSEGMLKSLANGNNTTNLTPVQNRLSYAKIKTGKHERVYIVDGHGLCGYVVDGLNFEVWGKGVYQGAATDRVFSAPISGQALSVYAGRMVIGYENHLFLSEPYQFDLFDLHTSRLSYGSYIRMIVGTDNGLWVSDSEKIYWIEGFFISGEAPPKQSVKAEYPSYEGTPIRVNMAEFPFEGQGGVGYLTVTPRGIVLLTPDGGLFNLTEKKLVLKTSENKPIPLTRFYGACTDNRTYFWLEGDTAMSSPITQGSLEYTGQSAVTLTADMTNKIILITTNPTTVTLPDLSSIPVNGTIKIVKMGAAALTVRASGSDQILTAFGTAASVIEATASLYSSVTLEKVKTGRWLAEFMGNWDVG